MKKEYGLTFLRYFFAALFAIFFIRHNGLSNVALFFAMALFISALAQVILERINFIAYKMNIDVEEAWKN